MSKYIKQFAPDTPEYARLADAAQRMSSRSPRGFHYVVGDCYFDFGQNWMWTTILCDNYGTFGGFQALNPRQQEQIVTGDIDASLDDYFTDKYCLDRIEAERIDRRSRADTAGLVSINGI